MDPEGGDGEGRGIRGKNKRQTPQIKLILVSCKRSRDSYKAGDQSACLRIDGLVVPGEALASQPFPQGCNNNTGMEQCDSVLLQSSLSLKAATIILGWDSVIVGSLVVGTHGCISRNTGLKSDVVGKFKYKEKWTRDQGMRIRIR